MKRLAVVALVRVLRVFAVFYEVHRYDEARRPDRFSMGRHSYSKPRVVAHPLDTAQLRIGSFCSIAADATFMLGGNHRPQCVSTFPFRIRLGLADAAEDGSSASKGDIEVGHDVWIGSAALILSGVRIGAGAVIGASAVVASDVRPYAIVVGNPAREVRRRFSDAQVEALLDIAWWDWPMDRILEHVPQLESPAIDEFIATAQRRAA
jgi:acetyltransferase-like isoleucine patch superfamily enzyme